MRRETAERHRRSALALARAAHLIAELDLSIDDGRGILREEAPDADCVRELTAELERLAAENLEALAGATVEGRPALEVPWPQVPRHERAGASAAIERLEKALTSPITTS